MTPDRPERKNPRLRGWDYGAGGTYFVTFCTSAHRPVLSSIRRGDPCGRPPLVLTPLGECVAESIALTGVRVEHQVIMPNHVHLLLSVDAGEHTAEGAPRSSRPTQLVPRMITALKRFTNQDMQNDLWQGGFHDHIIRSEADYLRIWAYMDQNPAKWREDRYHEEAYP